MTATVQRVRVQLWCTCGGTLDARSPDVEAVNGVAAAFERIHTGDGHGPANARQAAAARRRDERRELAR